MARGAGVELEEAELRRLALRGDRRRKEKKGGRRDEVEVEAEAEPLRPSEEEASDSESSHSHSTLRPTTQVTHPTTTTTTTAGGGRVPRQDFPVMSQTEAESIVVRKKHVILHDIVKLGDVFWMFLLLNCEFFLLSLLELVSIPFLGHALSSAFERGRCASRRHVRRIHNLAFLYK